MMTAAIFQQFLWFISEWMFNSVVIPDRVLPNLQLKEADSIEKS